MRALFFGTPAIAVPALNALHALADIAGVVCQPDRPKGRGLSAQPPPVKARAIELGLAVRQPDKIRAPDFAEWVLGLEADVALVIAYGRILPKAVLDGPRRGCLNLHASILPSYRGAAPIPWAIVRGETETGISLMQMDEGMDTGPVFSAHRLPIGPRASADELTDQLGQLAAQVVRLDLARAVAGAIPAVPQDHTRATTAPRLVKEDGRIPWAKRALDVHNHVRGMTSWPGAFTGVNGKILKVLVSQIAEDGSTRAPPGTVVSATRSGVLAACGTGVLAIVRGQIEGRKPLTAAELVAGRTLAEGMVLGSTSDIGATGSST
jgi:methionyl-tRNA formyltransferase